MKRTLDTGEEKISKICDLLRHETLEPAKEEALRIVEEAKQRSEEIIQEAHRRVKELVQEAQKAIEQERNVFHSTLSQAAKQSIEALRQEIEHRLFNSQLHELVTQHTADPQVVANLMTALVKAIEKEGISGDLLAYIPQAVPAKEVTALLTKEILEKLKKGVQLGNFLGGAKIRVEGRNVTLDISDKEIEDLLQRYVRKDFRKFLFGSA